MPHSYGIETSLELPGDRLTVLLVTDLQAFTPLLCCLGDARARELIHAHDVALRACLAAHHGTEIAHLGDGILAAFHSVRSALVCSSAIHGALEQVAREHGVAPLVVRIGVHAGEPLSEDGRLFGICVNTTFRICDAAQGGTTLLSDVVRQLAVGCALSFRDRGPFALDGLDHDVRLHELLWRAQASALRAVQELEHAASAA